MQFISTLCLSCLVLNLLRRTICDEAATQIVCVFPASDALLQRSHASVQRLCIHCAVDAAWMLSPYRQQHFAHP